MMPTTGQSREPESQKAILYQGGSMLPVPDPTSLTTQALAREINALEKLFTTRLDANDKAVGLLQEQANRAPSISVVDERLTAQRALFMEKFTSVSTEFSLRDIRSDQASRDTKTAVDAALQAAEKAVNKQNESAALAIAKSEASTIKSIDQIAILLQSVAKANDDKFSDLKDRLSAVEGRNNGQGMTVVAIILGFALIVSFIVIGTISGILHR